MNLKLFITGIISGEVPQAEYGLLKYMLCNCRFLLKTERNKTDFAPTRCKLLMPCWISLEADVLFSFLCLEDSIMS